jgi:type I restriction enzyme, R subunit
MSARLPMRSNDFAASWTNAATNSSRWQILHRLPYARRRLSYEAVDDLKEALKRPPWLLEPVDIWRAYKRLSSDKVRGNPAGTLADIVMLVRYAIGQAEVLEPLPRSLPAASTSGLATRRKRGASIRMNRRLG